MAALSDYLEQQYLNHAFGGPAFTQPTDWWIRLYNVSPSDSGGGTPVTGTGYSDLDYNGGWTLEDAGGGAWRVTNTADADFGTVGAGGWGTIEGVGVFDGDPATGNLLIHGDLNSPQPTAEGNTVKFLANQLILNLD